MLSSLEKSKQVIVNAHKAGKISPEAMRKKLGVLDAAIRHKAAEESKLVDAVSGSLAKVSISGHGGNQASMASKHGAASFPPLRDYQSKLVADLLSRAARQLQVEVASTCAALVYLPTGGGKTRIAAEVACCMLRRGQSTLFVVNRVQLLGQTQRAFEAVGIPSSCIRLIASSHSSAPVSSMKGPHVTIASLQTMARRFAGALSQWVPPVVSSIKPDTINTKRKWTALPLFLPKGGTTGPVPSDAPQPDQSKVESSSRRAAATSGDGTKASKEQGTCKDMGKRPLVSSACSSPTPPTELPPHHCVIVDEAHGAVAKTAMALTGLYRAAGSFVVGLTATPTRLREDENLGLVFDEVLQGPSVSELVERGVLVPPVVSQLRQRSFKEHATGVLEKHKMLKTSEGTGVRAKPLPQNKGKSVARGSRAAAAAAAAADPERDITTDSEQTDDRESSSGQTSGTEQSKHSPVRSADQSMLMELSRLPPVQEAVAAWRRLAYGRRTVAFAQSVRHSKAIVSAFLTAGISAEHIDGSTSKAERDLVLDNLTQGSTLVVSSVGVLSEGFDEPKVSCVMLLRSTQSKALYVQQVGRGLRQAPGKLDCVVIDQAGNTSRHGPVTKSLLKAGDFKKWTVHHSSSRAAQKVAAGRSGGGVQLQAADSASTAGELLPGGNTPSVTAAAAAASTAGGLGAMLAPSSLGTAVDGLEMPRLQPTVLPTAKAQVATLTPAPAPAPARVAKSDRTGTAHTRTRPDGPSADQTGHSEEAAGKSPSSEPAELMLKSPPVKIKRKARRAPTTTAAPNVTIASSVALQSSATCLSAATGTVPSTVPGRRASTASNRAGEYEEVRDSERREGRRSRGAGGGRGGGRGKHSRSNRGSGRGGRGRGRGRGRGQGRRSDLAGQGSSSSRGKGGRSSGHGSDAAVAVHAVRTGPGMACSAGRGGSRRHTQKYGDRGGDVVHHSTAASAADPGAGI